MIGIVMRTKDRPVLLRRALKSVMRQSWKKWHVVIANTGDPRVVQRVLESLGATDGLAIEIVHLDKELSAEAATNAALERLSGAEHIAFHDDDDSWAPDFLGICVRQLETLSEIYPATVAVIALGKRVDEEIDGNVVRVKSTELMRPHMSAGFISLNAMVVENQFKNIQLLVKKSAVAKIRFNSLFGGMSDWDFHLRLLMAGDIYVIPQVLVFSHVRSSVRGPYANRSAAARAFAGTVAEATILGNAWLRADISSGTVGLGFLNSIRPVLEHLSWYATQSSNSSRAMLERLHGDIGALGAELSNVSGRVSRRPVRNGFKLGYLWLRSGRALHYLLQFLRTANSVGLRQAVDRTKTWLLLQR
ncbi:glycosyltransferase [Caballeronia sp. LZ008]|uniref:glycosyltransferase family 2 protein n=1 Tax=unclassified Caballeronia TaxID=2646786 RepID=UPI0020286F0A|nr:MULTISPECIES: glycosyltransferase [unclassified Caballeronia]MDR5792515.1 glycosyltransferase [Caballeronia sp. LZ008]